MEKLSCIILNYNTSEMTHKVVAGFITAAKKFPHEIIVIDNGSTEILSEFFNEGVTVIKNQHNLGFAAGVNQGLKIVTGDYILLLNSDVFIDEKTIISMINYLENNPSVGIVGPMMVFPKGDFQASAGFFPTIWREILRFSTLGKYISGGTLLYRNKQTEKQFSQPIQVDWVSGGCMLIKKQVVEKIGFFDSRYFFSIEDLDFCFRSLQNNFLVTYLPTVSVVHYHGLSSGGHGSAYSLKQEKISMNLFLQKYFSSKIFFKYIYNFLSRIKIFIFEKIYK